MNEALADRLRRLAEEERSAELGLPFVHDPDLLDEAAAEITQLEAAKNSAYAERNKLVALLATIMPSGIKKTAIEGWSEDWHGCVYVDGPTGQLSWHYHNSENAMFAHLPPYDGEWDGHTTDEKYKRIIEWIAQAAEFEGENTL